MTEYWQSQAKKFCDFCKCWITDNKPSIQFHESGKKHKDNVERRIKEVRKRGIQVRKDDDELKRSLQAIEDAALQAYKKDIGEDNVSSVTPTTTANNRPIDNNWKPSSSTTSEPPKAGCSITYIDGQPTVHCTHHWSIGQSEQGYYYYYNTQQNTTQWDVPQCLQTDDSEDGTQVHEPPAINTVTETEQSIAEVTKDSSTEDKTSTIKEETEKTKAESPATGYSPYGAWTTVRTIEAPIITKETQARIQGEATKEQTSVEDPEVTAKKTEKKFKERETPKLSAHNTDVVVPFKKRKLNSERKRNIRQTKFDS